MILLSSIANNGKTSVPGIHARALDIPEMINVSVELMCAKNMREILSILLNDSPHCNEEMCCILHLLHR